MADKHDIRERHLLSLIPSVTPSTTLNNRTTTALLRYTKSPLPFNRRPLHSTLSTRGARACQPQSACAVLYLSFSAFRPFPRFRARFACWRRRRIANGPPPRRPRRSAGHGLVEADRDAGRNFAEFCWTSGMAVSSETSLLAGWKL